MNWEQIIAPVISFIIGIGVVWTFIEKFSPKVKKYISIASKALGLLDEVLKAVEDKQVSDIEIAQIRKEAEELVAALKQ